MRCSLLLLWLVPFLFACDSRSHSERAAIQFKFEPYESMPLQTFLGDYNDRLISHSMLRDSMNCLSGWQLYFGDNEIKISVGLTTSPDGNPDVCDSVHSWKLDDVRRFTVNSFEVVDQRRNALVYLSNPATQSSH